MCIRSLILAVLLCFSILGLPSFALPDEQLLAQESLELASEQTFHTTVTGIHTIRISGKGWALCAGMMNGQHTWFILQKTGTTWQAVKSISNYPTADWLRLLKVDQAVWPDLLGAEWLRTTEQVLGQLQAHVANKQKRDQLPKGERYYFPNLVLDSSGHGWAAYETYPAGGGSQIGSGHAFLTIHADRWNIHSLLMREFAFRPSNVYPIEAYSAISNLRQTIHSDQNPAKLYAFGSVPITLRTNQGAAASSGGDPVPWTLLASFESKRRLPRHVAPAPVPAGTGREIQPLTIKDIEGFWVNREGFYEVIEILNAGPSGWIISRSVNNDFRGRYRFEATTRGTLVLYPQSGPEYNVELKCFRFSDPAGTKVLELRLLDGSQTAVQFVKPPVR